MNSQPIGRMPIQRASTAAATQPNPPPDPVFSGLARLAAGACGTSLAAVAVIGYRDAWFTATAELPAEAVPAQDPFASRAAQTEGLFEVPDAAADERFPFLRRMRTAHLGRRGARHLGGV